LSSSRDQRGGADGERGGDGPQVRGLVVPVGLEHGDVLEPQQHVRMIAECGTRHGIVVLRADGKQDAPGMEPAGGPLHRKECLPHGIALPQDDPVHAVITHDSTPERIVEVEHKALAGHTRRCSDETQQMVGVQRNEFL
jgi:hypothetical protein